MPFNSAARNVRIAIVVVGAATGLRGDPGPPAAAKAHREFTSLAPTDVVGTSLGRIGGIAETAAAPVFTDYISGTLSRLEAGRVEVMAHGLEGPTDIVTGAAGELYVLEQRAGRVIRFDGEGGTTVVAGGLRNPKGLALGDDGDLWLAAHASNGPVLLRVGSSGEITTRALSVPDVRALAVSGNTIVVATPSDVRQLSIATGAPSVLLQRWQASALAFDAGGDLYLAGHPLGSGAPPTQIVKYHRASGRVTHFAGRMSRVGALAFDSGGSLFAADGADGGRIVRFAAPGSPQLDVAPFTNHAVIDVAGRTQPGSRVHVVDGQRSTSHVIADVASGRFTLRAPLARNAVTHLNVVATAAAGEGLASLPAAAAIVHDDGLPRVHVAAPAAAAFVRDVLVARVSAEDGGSGLASITVFIDDRAVNGTQGKGEVSLALAARLETSQFAEGAHTLTAAAEDRAGNQGAAAQLVVVDRTAPETTITEQPPERVSSGTVRFGFEGLDALSPVVELTWRLDSGAWSAYAAAGDVTLQGLSPGDHVFEVKARDLAGNEDATPASRAFRVQSLAVRILEPVHGTSIGTQTVWVRGEVDGVLPLTVSIPLTPELNALVTSVQANVVAGRFVAEVPVSAATSTLVVTASDATGSAVTDNVEVQVGASLAPPDRLLASPASGFAPHAIRLRTSTQDAGVYAVDLESDGTPDYLGDSLDAREFIYAAPGAFLVTARLVAPDGTARQWRAPVSVYDRSAVNLELQAAWSGMKDALRRGAPDEAAAFVHSARRSVWGGTFAELAAGGPTDVEGSLTSLEIVGFEGDRLECEMMRPVDGLMFSFPVTFAIDSDGRWRLWQF